jgi:hypothetical protein
MISENKCFFHSNNVVVIFRVIVSKMSKNIDFYISLVVKFLLITNDLESNVFFLFVIKAFKSLAKGPLSNGLNDLKSISDMVMKSNIIVTSFIIISTIDLVPLCSVKFVALLSNKPYLLKV